MSALDDDRLTLIETLENYPTPDVHIEGERLVEIIEQLTRVTEVLPGSELF